MKLFGPEPEYPPLSTTEIQALPEGARVIVAWSGGNGPHEYRVYWHRGEPYAQTEEEHRQGRVDVEKWLTTTSGRGAPSRESGLSQRRECARFGPS